MIRDWIGKKIDITFAEVTVNNNTAWASSLYPYHVKNRVVLEEIVYNGIVVKSESYETDKHVMVLTIVKFEHLQSIKLSDY